MLEMTVDFDGTLVRGYAADCLPPLWFDKSPEREFTQQIDDMIEVISHSAKIAVEIGKIDSVSTLVSVLWETLCTRGRPPLLENFGHSMVERCAIDALCRFAGKSFRDLLSAGELYGEFSVALDAWGLRKRVRPWSLDHSSDQIAVRHTVGLSDPLTTKDLVGEHCVEDGLPVSLEDHLLRDGIRFLKVKIGNRGKLDVERLLDIVRVVSSTVNHRVQFTLDGNEQYNSMVEFRAFWDEMNATPGLKEFVENVILIEQPLRRDVALDESATSGLRLLSREVPVIIDESDSSPDQCWKAISVGYSGTSSKACKGVTKALLNRQLIADLQQANEDREYVMTGEDLCCVGVVSLQTDLALVSVLGLAHVERNGHHYHTGLNYLPSDMYESVFEAHGDLYRSVGGIPALRIESGQLNLTSVNKAGFGFSIDPGFEEYQTVRQG